MTQTTNITRKRGDTCGIVFRIKKADGVTDEDISTWTNFLLTVDPSKAPTDALANEFQAVGAFVTDGTDGRVRFFPPGTTGVGSFYYDVQALDNDGKKCTPVQGKYKLTQDITKD